MSAGKGDRPRNCFSKNFKNNFADINWKKKSKKVNYKSCGQDSIYSNDKKKLSPSSI
jgi:hypothetical protein